MAPRSVVSEFPNDNPELHDGLVWACPTPCAPALPTLRLRTTAPARVLRPSWEPASGPRSSSAPLVAPEHLEPEQESVAQAERAVPELAVIEPGLELVAIEPVLEPVAGELEASEESEQAAESAFPAFVAALSAVLLERGATKSAATVGALLGESRLARDALDVETKKALVARGMLDGKSGRPTPEFSMVARAWRDVLDGTNADLGACGTATLDVWSAEIVAALLGDVRGHSDEIRRALRRRGVAAFGMLAAA